MGQFDFTGFLSNCRGLMDVQVILQAQSECARAEGVSFSRKGAVAAREHGSVEYSSNLKGLIFFLENGVRPGGVSESIFGEILSFSRELHEAQKLNPRASKFFDGSKK